MWENWKEIQKCIKCIKNNMRVYIPVICQIVGNLTSRDVHVLCEVTLDAGWAGGLSEMPFLERGLGTAGGGNLHWMTRWGPGRLHVSPPAR